MSDLNMKRAGTLFLLHLFYRSTQYILRIRVSMGEKKHMKLKTSLGTPSTDGCCILSEEGTDAVLDIWNKVFVLMCFVQFSPNMVLCIMSKNHNFGFLSQIFSMNFLCSDATFQTKAVLPLLFPERRGFSLATLNKSNLFSLSLALFFLF